MIFCKRNLICHSIILLEFWVVPLEEALPATGKYKLQFSFNGILTGRLSGLYKSTYKRDNETIGLVATQFQSISARKCFPSFDEPSFRPTFHLTVIHDSNTTAISNMPELETTLLETSNSLSQNEVTLKTTKFKETVNMVSYLLALVVSDFQCKKKTFTISGEEKWFRVCSSPDKTYKLNYTLEIGIGIMKFFADEYFKVPYPLPKQDQISIPDFAGNKQFLCDNLYTRHLFAFYFSVNILREISLRRNFFVHNQVRLLLRP